MIAVIFEATPGAAERDEYLAIATSLRPLLDGIDGFISIERFESLSEPGKLLSLSFWRDEEAVKRWRTMEQHRAAQAKGRARIFVDYRLRIASVIRDYGKSERAEAPTDSQEAHPYSVIPDAPQARSGTQEQQAELYDPLGSGSRFARPE